MDPLEQLADIHLPEQVHQLPLAPGWWLLALSVLTLIIVTLIKFVKRRRLTQFQREALTSLNANQLTVEQSMVVLKTSCMAYFPRTSVASLHGEQLMTFLKKHLPEKFHREFTMRFQSGLSHQYQKQIESSEDAVNFQQAVTLWIDKALPSNNKSKGEQ